MRRNAGLVAVLCLLALAPAAVAAPDLAATTIVEADAAAYLDVELREPVNLFARARRRQPYVIQGKGDVVILSVRSLERSGLFGRDNVEIVRMGGPGGGSSMIGMFTCPCSDPVGEMPPGRYRLYLQSDAPAKVTLFAKDGDDETTLRPAVPVPFASGPLTAYPTVPFTTVLGAWGNQLSDGGSMHLWARFDAASQQTADHLESCLLYEDEEAEGDDAFQPGCSGPLTFVDVQPLGSGGWSIQSSAYNFPAGRYGHGVNLTHAGETLNGSGFIAWPAFDDDAPPVDAADSPPVPAPAPASPPAAQPPSAGRLMLADPLVRVRRGRARVKIHCSADGPCTGDVSFAGSRRAATVALPAGRTATVRLPLPRARRRALARRKRLRATLVLRAQNAGRVAQTRVPVTLR